MGEYWKIMKTQSRSVRPVRRERRAAVAVPFNSSMPLTLGDVPPPLDRGAGIPARHEPQSRHVDVIALSIALELLPEVRSMHALELLIELRAQAERGQRPMTLGEALEFMIYRRGLSPAGSKKVLRQLIRQKLLIPAHSPCIDKAKDLLASRRLMRVFPIVARPYTVFRVSSEGELQRKKFDTAYLEPARLDPADVRLAEWLDLWQSQIRPGDDVPRSLTPFFKTPLSKRPSPSITAVVSVAAKLPGDYEMLSCDGPALADPPFAKAARAIKLRKMKSPSLAKVLKGDFDQAKLLQLPSFHHLTGTLRGYSHDYFRLILPVASDGQNVDCLVIVAELTSLRPPSKLDLES